MCCGGLSNKFITCRDVIFDETKMAVKIDSTQKFDQELKTQFEVESQLRRQQNSELSMEDVDGQTNREAQQLSSYKLARDRERIVISG